MVVGRGGHAAGRRATATAAAGNHSRNAADGDGRRGLLANPLLFSGLLAGAVILLAIVAWIISLASAPNTKLLVVPSDATISIDGTEYANGDYRFAEGTHFIRIVREGFDDYENEFRVTGAGNRVYVALAPSAGNEGWFLEHPAEQMLLNTIGDYRAAQTAKTYAARDTIFAYTPYYDARNRFQVYTEAKNDEIVLTVRFNTCADDAVEYYKKIFQNWLAEIPQVNAADYIIRYRSLCDGE